MLKRINIRQRKWLGTATEFTDSNPILILGETGEETDTGKWKRGDGSTRWGALSYQGGGEKGDKGDTGAAGQDGHTPIKGVDYFDGEIGPKGAPGTPGYTPVKNVDYFDGEQGPQGNPGSDAAVTKANVEAVLTGTISSHSHAGGSDGEVVVVLGSNQTTTSASFVDLAGLSFAVAANSNYLVEAWIPWRSSSTSYGIGFSFTGPANQTIAISQTTIALTTATAYVMSGSGYDLPNATSASPPAANTTYIAMMDAFLKTGGTSGTFQLRWRSENASGTMTALAGAVIRYRKVG